jgi:hypothetical protein
MTEHIKMPAISPLVRFVADGTNNKFNFNFPIFKNSDLIIRIDGVRQYSAFVIKGAGKTNGGTVEFTDAPKSGGVITLERRLPLERITDFIEGGDFSARSINNELDYLMGSIQQVQRDQSMMLRYQDAENPAITALPEKSNRANKALGFDNDGNPIAISLEGSVTAPDFKTSGMGSITRTINEKGTDFVSIKDFGAVGDGLTDDTDSIKSALSAHQNIFVPKGTYLITQAIELDWCQSLMGVGQASIIKTDSTINNVIDIIGCRNTVENLSIQGGKIGISLYGLERECTQNTVRNVHIFESGTGILLDGYESPDRPCYWNNFERILIEKPTLHGVHLKVSGSGDTPNANKFLGVRVYSKGTDISGSGFYIEAGSLNNSLIDCEANLKGTAHSIIRIGANASFTQIYSFLSEGNNLVNNILLEEGSSHTSIVNLTAMSDGYAIKDESGGKFTALNTSYDAANQLDKVNIIDLSAKLMRYHTKYISEIGTHELDLSSSMYFVNATSGAITVTLPKASTATGAEITVKKVDALSNIVTIDEVDGNGPDGKLLLLGGQGDYATVICDGMTWHVKSSNRTAGNTRYVEDAGTYSIDLAVDTYVVWATGDITMQLPPADSTKAIGRSVTIKKIDVEGSVISITEQGGDGPDRTVPTLTAQYDSITVLSDGGRWYITQKYSA